VAIASFVTDHAVHHVKKVVDQEGALVIKAFDNSQTITTAMVQRGYDGSMPLLRHKPLRVKEVALSMTFLLAMGALWRI